MRLQSRSIVNDRSFNNNDSLSVPQILELPYRHTDQVALNANILFKELIEFN